MIPFRGLGENEDTSNPRNHWYTNQDIYDLLDPNEGKSPYIYDNFRWDHCLEAMTDVRGFCTGDSYTTESNDDYGSSASSEDINKDDDHTIDDDHMAGTEPTSFPTYTPTSKDAGFMVDYDDYRPTYTPTSNDAGFSSMEYEDYRPTYSPTSNVISSFLGPTYEPTSSPDYSSPGPTTEPTQEPTQEPSNEPTSEPTHEPTIESSQSSI